MSALNEKIYVFSQVYPWIWSLIYLVFFFAVMGSGLYCTLGQLFVIRKKLWQKGLLLAGCAFIVGMVIYLGDWGNIIPTFLFFTATVCVCCEGSIWKRIAVSLMFSSIFFSLNALLDNWVENKYFRDVLTVNLVRVLFCIGLYCVIRRLSLRRDFELSKSMWKLVILLTVTPLGVVFGTVLLSDGYSVAGRDATPQNFVILLLTLFSFLGILSLIIVLERQQRLEEQQVLYEMNQSYYRSMAQQNEEVRRLRHDMNNHLQTVYGLEGERREEYLRELLSNPSLSRQLKYCGDDTVNAVISSKTYLMEQKEIIFQSRLEIPKELSLEKPDICAIFGNALDNAIEAVQKLPSALRSITMEARLGKGMLVLKVVNPCEDNGETEEKDGIWSTTKKDRTAHGFGLLSIREAARKYQGRMEIKREAGQFELLVYLRCEG